MEINRAMPPLFGVTTANDIYCDIITNMNIGMNMNSMTRNVTIPTLLIIITSPFLYLCFSLLEENDILLFLGLAGCALIYFCIYALRCALEHPKTLTIRLNRQQQKVYIQKHQRTFNIFAKWPIETLIYDWNLIEAHFGQHVSRYYGPQSWYRWHAVSSNGTKTSFTISEDILPMWSPYSRLKADMTTIISGYEASWEWCNHYMSGAMPNLRLVSPENEYSYKYCVTAISSRIVLRANQNDKWTTIFPLRDPFFLTFSIVIVPFILLDALAMRWIMRRLPDTPWSDSAQTESTLDS
ncbi:DUF6708 domain-containing protein [Klebsiella aerogenes]|uniref:DUF6708 domain-containing protein n=1 Tax=Klebsiella aerogenes TaxID=548 RepID=UPI001BD45376|nr:DUF6708 domain-containing protein [Klebsiella aerogenes]